MLPDEISTTRLLLRPFQLDDAEDVFVYARDPEWRRYLPLPDPYTRLDANRFVATSILADRMERPNWAITREGRVVGAVSIRFFADHRIGELGYSISRDVWGQGFTTEAVSALIDHAFVAIPMLIRIRAHADARNRSSARVMEKVGMTYEGTLRSNRFLHEEAIDELCYAILRSEWNPGRA